MEKVIVEGLPKVSPPGNSYKGVVTFGFQALRKVNGRFKCHTSYATCIETFNSSINSAYKKSKSFDGVKSFYFLVTIVHTKYVGTNAIKCEDIDVEKIKNTLNAIENKMGWKKTTIKEAIRKDNKVFNAKNRQFVFSVSPKMVASQEIFSAICYLIRSSRVKWFLGCKNSISELEESMKELKKNKTDDYRFRNIKNNLECILDNYSEFFYPKRKENARHIGAGVLGFQSFVTGQHAYPGKSAFKKKMKKDKC